MTVSDSLLTISDVAELLSECKRQVSRLVAEERLPAPLYLGRLPRWRESEISAWIAADCPDRETFEATRGKAVR